MMINPDIGEARDIFEWAQRNVGSLPPPASLSGSGGKSFPLLNFVLLYCTPFNSIVFSFILTLSFPLILYSSFHIALASF
jgi:hypothetical protein